jgi:hypothetical protein
MMVHYLISKYIWLVNTIRMAKKISLADINRLCLKTEMSGGVELLVAVFWLSICKLCLTICF